MAGGKSASAKSSKSPGGNSDNEPPVDAIALLEADHRAVEGLFKKYGKAGPDKKRAIANAICAALKVHARLEEDLFYPAALMATGETSLLQEAMVEHASASDLVAQIESGFPADPLFDARVTVLGEYVRHHVAEEEGELFRKVRKTDLDLVALGEALAQRKQQLMLGLTVSNPVLLNS